MISNFPVCCSPEAFKLLKRQSKILESSDGLLGGALAISMQFLGDVDLAAVDGKIQAHVDRVRGRVRGAQPQALLAHMHQYLFDDVGFAGNVDDYYGAANSYLPLVLENKVGLPITLSLIYKLVGERLGFKTWGIGLPGHFLAGIQTGETSLMIDCFSAGRVLSIGECRAKIHEMFGEEAEWSEEFLSPISNRHWLTRMLQNLLRYFGSEGQYANVAAVLEMEMLLWPKQTHLQRDLALVLARIGMAKPASIWLKTYLDNNPDDPQRNDLEQLRDVLLT